MHYRMAVLAVFGLVLLLIIASGLQAYRNVRTQDETAALVIRTQAVLAALNQLEMTLVDAETGQRGYLLTGEAHFLEPWLSATGMGKTPAIRRPPIGQVFASLHAQLGLSGVERELLGHIEGLAGDKLAELQETIDLRRAGRMDEALAIVREGRGKRIMDALRLSLSDLRAEQRQQIERSEAQRQAAARSAYRAGIASCVAAVLAIAVLLQTARRAEHSLLQREREFKIVADNISQHAWTLDADGRFLWFNRRWQEYTGLHEPDLDAQWLSAIDHPVHRERVEHGLRHAVASGEAFEQVLPLRARDGSWRWFLVRAQPIQGPGGHISRWFGSNTDIDERLQLEQALKDANRRKDEFIATLAHELRNPLAPIQAGLELMRISPSFPPPLVRTRDIMHRQLAHLVRLIDDLLDVSRISTGRLELQRRVLPVRAIVESALEASRVLVESSGHALEVTLPAEPLAVDGDPVRLAQVLGILLNNSAKYTPIGGRVVVVVARDEDAVRIDVADTGIGIDPAMLPDVFDLFSHTPEVRHQRHMGHGGIGIGLAIARRLVDMHGGTLSVQSAGVGHGSTFTIRLPLARTLDAGPASVPPASARDGAAQATSLRILILDDNVDAAQTLGALLGSAGHAVTLAHTGQQAIDLARHGNFELAFLDIGLPDMTGYDVARALRAQPGEKNLRLVALSGWGAAADRIKSREAGVDHHLTKPVTLQALATTLPDLALPEGAGV